MIDTTAFTGRVEFAPTFTPRPGISHVLFDFDGTLSLIRQGWPDVMVPMFAELLPPLPGETEEDRRRLAFEDIMRLNGKQTIYQMIQLAEEVKKRGGKPRDPLQYKQIYHDRLWERIAWRVAGLKNGAIAQEEMVVPGSIDLLRELRKRGVTLYLASGTDLSYVQDEASAIGVSDYFNGGIYGALDQYEKFSKKILINEILKTYRLQGSQLVTFGDGYVEIENTKEVGGIAVGVASDEVKRCGINEWKRNRLINAGADLIIPDHREHERLLRYLFNE
jgi:phosphoglycolate phosphatase-like HAD superfamily hydrolase